MPKLALVIGANATGKTFFIEQKYVGRGAEILNIYDYQQRVYEEAGFKDGVPFGAQFRCLKRANELLLSDICERLSQGRDVVAEQTFYKAKRRIAYIDEIRKIPDVTIEVYIMQPSDSLWESNLEKRGLKDALPRHKREAEGIEFPNMAEGMDRIYEVVDGEIRQRHDPPKPEIVETAREELAKEADRIRAEDGEKAKREALLDSMNTRKFWHYCEVCGKKAYITAEEAHDDGWDYPPKMGWFGMLGPRTCGECGIADTLFWKVNTSGGLPIVCEGDLIPEELVTWRRIRREPESLLEEDYLHDFRVDIILKKRDRVRWNNWDKWNILYKTLAYELSSSRDVERYPYVRNRVFEFFGDYEKYICGAVTLDIMNGWWFCFKTLFNIDTSRNSVETKEFLSRLNNQIEKININEEEKLIDVICKSYNITEEEIKSLLSFLKVVYTIGNISPASRNPKADKFDSWEYKLFVSGSINYTDLDYIEYFYFEEYSKDRKWWDDLKKSSDKKKVILEYMNSRINLITERGKKVVNRSSKSSKI